MLSGSSVTLIENRGQSCLLVPGCPGPGKGSAQRAQWPLMSSTGKSQGQEVARVSVRAWRTRQNMVVVSGGKGVSGCSGDHLFHPVAPTQRLLSPLPLSPCVAMRVTSQNARDGRACILLFAALRPRHRVFIE